MALTETAAAAATTEENNDQTVATTQVVAGEAAPAPSEVVSDFLIELFNSVARNLRNKNFLQECC